MRTKSYGAFEDVNLKTIKYPVIIKEAAGAMSSGVFLAKCEKEFVSIAKRISRTKSYKSDIKDALRFLKHKNYIKESLYRKKFVIQEFIQNLKSDYKVLIWGERYYIFERPVRNNDFRASGSGNEKYIYGSHVDLPEGIFNFSKQVFNQLNVPQLSLDIAYDGTTFYIIEYQVIYFGTVGHVLSDGFFLLIKGEWKFISEKLDLEQVYAESIDFYIKESCN